MNAEKKYKPLQLQVKDIDGKKGIVTFYAAAFGNNGSEKDSDGDVITKGAFSKTLKEQAGRIKHCKNHDTYQVPGVLQEIKEDSYGLLCISKLAQRNSGEMTTLAKDTLIEYESGVITEHSIGFRAIKEAIDEQEKCNFITEVKLWEVSSLTAWGANKNTPVVGIKSQSDILEQLKAIDKVLRTSSISDEGAKKLLKYSRRILKSLKSKEAAAGTLGVVEPIAVDYNFLLNNFKL